MRVVVMDKEMAEPLTVIEVPIHRMREIGDGTRPPYIQIPVPESFADWFTARDRIPNVGSAEAMPVATRMRVATLRMEPIYTWDGSTKERRVLHWIAVPDSEELALLLRAAFLPGQVTEVKRREAQAWFQGAVGNAPPR